LSIGISSTSTYDEEAQNTSGNNTSDSTSGNTGNKTYRETTSSSRFYITTLALVRVTPSDGTVIGDRANNIEYTASSNDITLAFVANISCVTDNSGVCARIGGVGGIRITNIDRASVVIVASVLGDRLVNATIAFRGRNTTLPSTSVVVIAKIFRFGSPDALGTKMVLRIGENAFINSASIEIVTICSVQTSRLRGAQVNQHSQSGVLVAIIF